MADLYLVSTFAKALTTKPSTYPKKANDLQNHIHPIFAKKNFSGLEDGDYMVMRHGLKVASRIFETTSFCNYVDTMVNGRIFTDDAQRQRPGKEMSRQELIDLYARGEDPNVLRYPQQGLPRSKEAVAARTRRVLRALTDLVSLEVNDSLPDGVDGETRPRRDQSAGPNQSRKHERLQPTHKSTIVITKEVIESLKAFSMSKRPTKYEFFRLSFRLASILLHELAHALAWAVGVTRKEAYYHNNRVAEAGFQLEQLLFGGIVATWPNEHGTYVQHWPNEDQEASYRATGSQVFARWAEPTCQYKYVRAYAIEPDRILRLFHEDFWRDFSSKPGSEPIFPRGLPTWVARGDAADIWTWAPRVDEADMPAQFQKTLRRAIARDLVIEAGGGSQVLESTGLRRKWLKVEERICFRP